MGIDDEAKNHCTNAITPERLRTWRPSWPWHEARTLARAGERLGVDASTVFRSLKRVERKLGQRLFERGRGGYLPDELATQLAGHAEEMEVALESARSSIEKVPSQVSGAVRISTTDVLLHGLIAPALATLRQTHPLLAFDLHTSNELVNLTRRDADVAVRATRRPPQHLVGRKLGTIEVAVYAAKRRGAAKWADVEAERTDWIGVDDAMPGTSVGRVAAPALSQKVVPRFKVGSILSVLEFTALGIGVGILPLFLGEGRRDLVRLTDALTDAETDLWLLAHPESRHLRRVSVTYTHLSQAIRL